MADELPQVSNRFQIEERLGSEAPFEVFRAVEASSRRRVIVRILTEPTHPDAAGWEIDQAAKAMMALAYPGLLPVLEVGGQRARPYIVTPALEVPTLEQLLVKGGMPLPEALRTIGQVAEAIDHAHRAGVVHGVLSASSILMSREGRPLIADVGVARWVELAVSPAEGTHSSLLTASGDFEALRQITERVIAVRPSLSPAALSPAAPREEPRPSARMQMPVAPRPSMTPTLNSRASVPPPASVTTPSMPSSILDATLPSPTAGSDQRTLETSVAAAKAPSLVPAPMATLDAAPSSPPPLPPPTELMAIQHERVAAVGEVTRILAVAMHAPAPEQRTALSPDQTLHMSLLPRPNPSDEPIGLGEIDESDPLTPRYVVVAQRGLELARVRGLEAWTQVCSASERLAVRLSASAHGRRIVEAAQRALAAFSALFAESAPLSLDDDESSSPELPSGLRGGWFSWPRSKRIAVASGGAITALLFFMMVTSGGSSDATSKSLDQQPLAEQQFGSPAKVEAASISGQSSAEAKPKTNLERLREKRAKK